MLPSSKIEVTLSPRMAQALKIAKWFNTSCGIGLIVLGVLRYVFFSMSLSEPWTMFQPAYLIIFGLIIAGAELENGYVLQNVQFMNTFFGRAICEIFVATIASSYAGSTAIKVLVYILTISLFGIGLVFIIFYFLGYHPTAELIIKPTPQDLASQNSQPNANIHSSGVYDPFGTQQAKKPSQSPIPPPQESSLDTSTDSKNLQQPFRASENNNSNNHPDYEQQDDNNSNNNNYNINGNGNRRDSYDV